jgi:hypothetical protein
MNSTGPRHPKELSIFRTILWQDVCKFLAGAFFVNAGILFYLYLARIFHTPCDEIGGNAVEIVIELALMP